PPDRRATRRFADLWTQASRGRFPAWNEIKRIDFAADWEWIFVVDLKLSNGFPYFIFLGRNLAKLSDVYLTGDLDWTLSLLDKATCEINACVAASSPIYREEALTLCNGRRVLFRSVTAPLADDGETVTHAAGLVSGAFAD
ncbi:MAG: hypothetical protein WD076_02160, partial [Parvularculaceae bacterium]